MRAKYLNFLWMVLLILPLFVGCSTQPINLRMAQENAGTLTLPLISNSEGLFQLDVQVNGQGPYRFILDTGATKSVIFSSLRRELQLTETKGRITIHGLTGSGERDLVTLTTFSIASLDFDNLEVIVLENRRDDTTVKGIIGLDILRQFTLFFNTEEHTLSLIPAAHFNPRAFLKWDRLSMIDNPYGSYNSGLIFVNVQTSNNSFPGLIDTGSVTTLINWKAALLRSEVKRRLRKLREEWVLEGAIGEFKPRQLARYSSIRIGRHIFTKPIVLILDFTSLDIIGAKDNPFMVIGADLLYTRNFVIDFSSNRLFMQNPEKEEANLGSRIPGYQTGSTTIYRVAPDLNDQINNSEDE